MSARTEKTVLCLLAGVLLGAGAICAAAAKIDGVVVDQEEKPIAGAVVTITATDGSDQQTATSNRRGKFSLVLGEMAPSGYTLRVEAEGFATWEGPVEPEEGRTLDVTVPLLTQEAAEKVQAEIAQIEARNKAARRYNEGTKEYNEGNTERAIELFREAIAEEPELSAAWAALGRVFLEQQRFAEASEVLERLSELEPEQELVQLMLHDSYQGEGDEEAAAALLERLIVEFPGRGVAERLFNQGVQLIRGGDLAGAKAKFQRALEVYPELYQAHLNLAHIARAYEEWETALSEVDRFLAEQPEHARALALRYQALRSLDRPEATAALATLQQSAPGEAAQIFHEEGVTLFNANQVDRALEVFLAVLEIDPDHPRANYRAGLCYLNKGDNAMAREYLQKFIDLAPEDPEAASARDMLAYL